MFQPLFVRPLGAEERDELLELAGSPVKEESWRAEVILMSSAGKTASEIGKALGFHPSNIKKWIRKFNNEGLKGIAPRKRGPQGGPRPRFTQGQVDGIIKLSKTDPALHGFLFRHWTPQKLANAAVERGIVDSISHVTVRQLLKRAGASVQAEELDPLLTGEGDIGEALESSNKSHLQIGREALKDFNYERAVRHLQWALSEGIDSPEDEASARCLLTRALEELSRYEEALKVIAVYEDPHVLSALAPRTCARIKLRTGWVHSLLRNPPKSIASLNEALKLFLELQDNLGVSEAHYALGRTYIVINEFRIARDHLLTSASFQKNVLDRELLARVYDQLGTVDFNEGAFSNSKENYLKALELAEGSSNSNLLGMILLNLGTTLVHGHPGEREESAKYIKRAISYLEKEGPRDTLALAYNNLGDGLRYSGLWEEAVVTLNKAIEIAHRFKDPNYEATARVTLSEIFCGMGRFSDAEAHLMRCLSLIEGMADKWLESNALRILANAYRGVGRTDAALRTLRQTLQLSTSIGDLHGVTLAHIALAEFHFQQGGYEQAREYLELAHSRVKDDKSLSIAGLIQRLTGQLEAASGRVAEAKQHIAQSISIFTTTEIPYELAKSHYEMGLLQKKARNQKGAESSLQAAARIFEKLGAKPDLELTTRALALLSSGGEREPEPARVTPPSDVLLMQRLIEASASRELLVQELAAVVHEYFPARGVIICRVDDGSELEPLATQGLERHEAERLCGQIDVSGAEAASRSALGYLFKIGIGGRSPIILFIQPTEPLDIDRLNTLLKPVELGLETCSLRAAARGVTPATPEHRVHTIMPGFIIGSAPMFDVINKIQKIRTNDVTVLITGESGTGKELVARAIHTESSRARAIFLPFNCTATPKEIIDSQLFGHRRGAFTGATANYPGIIKAADGGTLFLDEIGDLSLEVQPKLMRFLQESEIQPLGETKPLRVDVRVLAATNTDLERAVEDGRFREDLFHRLNIIRIHVPPLRDRREEIPVLAAHFLEHFSARSGKPGISFSQEAVDALVSYDWPGNVRQLRNEVERVLAYASEGARISTEDLSPEVARPRKSISALRSWNHSDRAYSGYPDPRGNGHTNGHRAKVPYREEPRLKLKEATAALERELIEEALIRNRNNLSRTALDLGLSRRGLRLKLEQLGIQRDERF